METIYAVKIENAGRKFTHFYKTFARAQKIADWHVHCCVDSVKIFELEIASEREVFSNNFKED